MIGLSRWVRLTRHDLARRQAIRALGLATGDDFDLIRDRVFELSFCLSPETCEHLDATPIRKLVSG